MLRSMFSNIIGKFESYSTTKQTWSRFKIAYDDTSTTRLSTMALYKLKTNQPHQTNHKLTGLKVFLCGSVYNTLSVMIREEVTRFVILISRVKTLQESEAGFTSASYLKSFRPCLPPPSPRTPSMNHLLKRDRFIMSQQMARRSNSINLCSTIFDTHLMSFSLESILPLEALIPVLLEEVKCSAHSPLCGLSLTSLARGRHLGASHQSDQLSPF